MQSSSFIQIGYDDILSCLLDDSLETICQEPGSAPKEQETKSDLNNIPDVISHATVVIPKKRDTKTVWHFSGFSENKQDTDASPLGVARSLQVYGPRSKRNNKEDKPQSNIALHLQSVNSNQTIDFTESKQDANANVPVSVHYAPKKKEDTPQSNVALHLQSFKSNHSIDFTESKQDANVNMSVPVHDSSKNRKEPILYRKLRNREQAKRSRVRRTFLLDSLKTEINSLQAINAHLRFLIQTHIPLKAQQIISRSSLKSPSSNKKKFDRANAGLSRASTDYTLVPNLSLCQRNFILTDPHLPDNPIIAASQGFYQLTGYAPEQVLGRNGRFLQGPWTDSTTVQGIKTSINNGVDVTACILNYKADGRPFWNQMFIAPFRNVDNCNLKYVSCFI